MALGRSAKAAGHILISGKGRIKMPKELFDKMMDYLAINGLNIVAAILILLIGRWLSGLVSKWTEKAMLKSKVEPTICRFTHHMLFTGLMGVVIIATLAKLGIDTGSFVVVLGAAGLAVGLALQGSLSNFAAGILLIIFRPFKVGDFIEAGGTSGVVKEIQIFTTILNTRDNIRVVMPNSQVTGGNILNYSANGTRRVDLVFGVSYGDDLKRAKQVIKDVLAGDERILTDPAPTVAVSELADSSVNIIARPWVNVPDYWDVYFDTTESVKLALEANGLTIPFPQRDVHMMDDQSQVGYAGLTAKSQQKESVPFRDLFGPIIHVMLHSIR